MLTASEDLDFAACLVVAHTHQIPCCSRRRRDPFLVWLVERCCGGL